MNTCWEFRGGAQHYGPGSHEMISERNGNLEAISSNPLANRQKPQEEMTRSPKALALCGESDQPGLPHPTHYIQPSGDEGWESAGGLDRREAEGIPRHSLSSCSPPLLIYKCASSYQLTIWRETWMYLTYKLSSVLKKCAITLTRLSV